MEDWKTTTLGEVCKRGGGDIQTGPFGSQLHASDYVSVGIPSIMPINIGDNRINSEGIARITIEDAKRLEKYRVKEGDIIYSRRGDVERRALIRAQEDGWLCGTGCLRIRFGEGVVDPLFASYYLGDPEVRKWIVRHAVGATMPNLNTSILSALPFVVPPIEEQKAVANILSSFDDKIELNQQMNATLEAIARALFKAWFVDFEPVRANLENRSSESASPEIAKLFPSEFENGIPKGWRVGTLSEISFNHRQNINPSEMETGTAYVGLEHIPRKSIALTDWGKSDKAESTKSYFRENDILFGKLRPYFHKVVIAPIDGICSTDILVIRAKERHDFGQTLIHFSSDEIIQYADRLSNGAKMPRTSWSDLAKFEIVIATKQVSEEFSRFAVSIAERIKTNISENKQLEQIRDSLLPRLISRKSRVGAAEKML